MDFELLRSDVEGWVPTVAQMVRKSELSGNAPVLAWNQKDGLLYGLRVYGGFKSVICVNGLSAPAPVPSGMYQGVAYTFTDPGTPSADEWWTVSGTGTFTNFGGIEVTNNTDVLNYFKWTQDSSSWSLVTVAIPGANLIQLQADWNQTDTTAKDYIKNKPAMYVDRRTTKLLYGSVTWISGLTFQVSDLEYYLLGVFHTAAATEVSLPAGDETYDRIDVIYVDYFGNISSHQGLPSSDPVKPMVDPYFELELTQVYVSATATEPANIGEEIVYTEAVEWSGSEITGATDVSVNFTDTNTPDTGTYQTRVSKTGASFGTEVIAWQKADTFYQALGSVLIMRVRTSSGFLNSTGIVVTLKANATQIGTSVIIHNGIYGFDGSSLDYQTIAIPFSDFNAATSQVNIVQLSFAGVSPLGAVDIDFDGIKFQSGITPGITVEEDPVFQAWLATDPIPVVGTISPKDFWTGTQAAYDALGTYDSNTIYMVEEA